MKSFIAMAFLASLVSAVTLHAQPRGPQLLAAEEGKAEKDRAPLGLASADIRIVIAGPIAETTMTLTFRNGTPRILEGELMLPLPEGATVSGFGLDVNGYLVDGVPVEKQKARVTYEKETRKRIDPGLVEQAVGNNFRTRIYPIPAKGKRTVKVQYVSDVIDGKDGGATYRLPLGWDQPVGEANIYVEAAGIPTVPATLGDEKLAPAFATGGGPAVAHLKNARLDRELIVTLPKSDRQVVIERHVKGATVQEMIEKKTAPQGRSEWYFAISDIAPADAPVSDRRLDAKPIRVGVLWDASLSRLATDKTREIALLRKVAAAMNDHGTIDLVVFRNEPEPPVSFQAADVEKLIDAIGKLTYDGGTDLSKLPIVKNPMQLPGWPGNDKTPSDFAYWLLFTDGIADLGPEMPRTLAAPCYTISNDPKSNHALLRRIAGETGARYFNLVRTTPEDAAVAIGQEPFVLMGVEPAAEGKIADVYPRGAQPVTPGGRVLIAGQLLVPETTVTLKYGRGGVVTHRQEITLKQSAATETGLVPRFWAQQKVADLSSDAEQNHDALLAIGKAFNLVTPTTSLLVLETVDQYVEHRIVPPRSYKGVYDEFMKRIEQEQQKVAQTREERIQHVLGLWKQRVEWWDQKHEYAADFKYKEPQGQQATNANAATAVDALALPQGAAAPLRHAPAPTSPTQLATGRPAERNVDEVREQVPDLSLASRGEHRGRGTGAGSGGGGGGGQGLFGGQGLADGADGKKDDRDSRFGEAKSPSIAIKQWDPDVPYLKAMREAGKDADAAYSIYLKQRAQYLSSPAFYFDCADYLLHAGHTRLGVRVLTNVAELKLEDAQLLRIVAHRLNQLGQRDLAIDMFERIKAMRPEEPQSWRDLALALSDRADSAAAAGGTNADPAKAVADDLRALDLLNHVVMNQWDRFEEIEVTALMEANRIIAALDRLPRSREIAIPLDPRLLKNLDCDVRIVLTWDADLTDVDLWVVEPSGEKCFYGHNRTVIGGLLSRDFTQGYGPEEYCLRKLMPGEYKIQCNYYGSSQTSIVGPTTVQATVITNFGRPDEKRQALTVRLAQQKDVVDIGAVMMK
jgi:tetratricopeptide (TPR) repeat protein